MYAIRSYYVFDNVAYGLKLRKIGHAEIEKRVNETLALVGLADYGDRAPSKLSGGGLRTVYMAGMDDRVKCAVCVGFSYNFV